MIKPKSERQKLKTMILKIMESIPEPKGGRSAWVDAVKGNDGRLSEFGSTILNEAVSTIVGEILRGKRDPDSGAHLFHSIVETIAVDDDGNALTERVYRRAADVYDSIPDTDQVVDYYVGQSRAYAKEANLTVKAATAHNAAYQRSLPFPDLGDDSVDG